MIKLISKYLKTSLHSKINLTYAHKLTLRPEFLVVDLQEMFFKFRVGRTVKKKKKL